MCESTTGIGIDIGGTKIAGAIVDGNGQIQRSHTVATPPEAPQIAVAVAELVDQLCSCAGGSVGIGDSRSIGIAAAGFVAPDRSTITFAPNIAWRNEPFGSVVAELTGAAVVVENDANAAAWGEFRFGAGADVDDLLLLTVGTGLGGGVVNQGQLMRGGFGAAGELGHVRLVPGGRPCGCGQLGCLEQYASGSALCIEARASIASGDPRAALLRSRSDGPESIVGPLITELAQQGDPLCLELFGRIGGYLGQGCASLVAALDPSVIAIGGGVAAAADLLLDPVREAFVEHLPGRGYRQVADVRVASLGSAAGVIGAADLARVTFG